MNQLQVVKASIHQNSSIALSIGDFNKNQQVLELLKNFLLDYANSDVFRSIILDDSNPQTIFVLYSILQIIIKNGDHFYNFPHLEGSSEQYFYNEFENRTNITNLCTLHVDIALTYLKRKLEHPTYVYNQVIFSIALLIRKYWIEINRIEELIYQIIQSTKFQYQQIFFNLFDNLISCVRQYSYAGGYIEFRKTMSSFSASSLQRIIEATLIEIQSLGSCSFIQLYQNNKQVAQAFIGLLHQILSVNFNLSYYEIDFDNENRETSQLTNFPDYYFDLITNANFLKEIFCGVISFLKVDQNLSLSCITMLQRIACVRLSIFHKKNCKGAFRSQLWEGLLYLYQNQDSFIIYPEFSQEVHSLTIRIINNLTLRKLHKFSDLFERCFLLLSNVYTKTIQMYGMKVMQNNPCTKLQELWNQIGYQVSLHLAPGDDLNQRVSQVMQNHLTIVLNAFFSQASFSEVSIELSPKKFKKMIALLFIPFQYLFKQKLTDNLQILLLMIQQLQTNFCEYKCASLICLAQSFLLYVQATDSNNFGYDGYSFAPREEARPSSDIKASVLKYVIEVIINPQIPKTTKIFQMASLTFMDSFTTATLDSLCYDKDTKALKNLSQLYGELIRIDPNYQNYLLLLEKMLEECFQVFTCTDPTLIEFTLKLIEFIYSKVKRLLPRNLFKSCGITQMLKQFFLQLNITCLNSQKYIKKRALIFKIIAIVWVDDQSDEYVSSLVEIYTQIKKNIFTEMNKENMLKYMWDLIGIASEIDNDNIYRTFLRVIYSDLAKILTPENIEVFVKDYDSSIAILTLLRAIFYNKNTRIQTENILLILYQIYGKAINFFIILMKIQVQNVGQQLSDNQIKQVHKLMAVMSQISNSKIFNQGFFIIYNDLTLLELFKNQIKLILAYRPLLLHIPKYKKQLYELFDNICQEHPETLAYKCEVNTYVEIFMICKESLKDVMKDNQGDDSINENCSTLIQVGTLLSNIGTFLIQEAQVGHENDLQMIQNKIQQIVQQGKPILAEIFTMSCQISIIYPKNSKILYSVPEILYGVSIFSPLEFEQLLIQVVSNHIGINHQFIETISGAFKNLQTEQKISVKEDFVKKVKQILEAYK